MASTSHPADTAQRWRERLDAIAASLQLIERERMQSSTADGRPLDILDLGVSGTIDGWVLRDGLLDQLASDSYGWLLDTDIALAQERFLHFAHVRPGESFAEPQPTDVTVGRAVAGVSRFDADRGAGLRLLLPQRGTDWDGRLWVLTSGTGVYRDMACVYVSDDPHPRPGQLTPRARDGGYTEGLGANLYAETLLDRGSAVAWIRKDEVRPPDGVNHAVLPDGSSVRVSHHSNVSYTLAFIELAQRELASRLGNRPTRTYLYGHSSGAATARLVNLRPHCNVRGDGSRIVDGLLCDDAAAGMYFPLAYNAAGRDTVLLSDADRERFVPQIDVSRGLYRPAVYLPIKRRNAEILRAKGFGDRHRHYEIAGVSHFDAGMADQAGRPSTLDLGGVWAALFEDIDAWVSGDAPAPPSCEHEDALILPEVACPLGIWEAPSGGPKTTFTPFDGEDGRDTITQAWRRLGLLPQDAHFSIEMYSERLAEAADALVRRRLLCAAAAAWTVDSARELLARSGARR